MTPIHFGLKLWSNNINLIDYALYLVRSKSFQYIELTIIPGTDISPFLDSDIPFIIHQTPDRYGANIANGKLRESNHTVIDNCLDWADQLNAHYIILHPGFGCLECAMNILSEYDDPRLIIENMPKKDVDKEKFVGFSPDQIQHLCQGKFGVCLDLNHAIKAALTMKKDYHEVIEAFLALKPVMFHISDGSLHIEIDEHLNFGDGEYPLQYLKGCINRQKNRYVTLETPKVSNSLDADIRNLALLKKL